MALGSTGIEAFDNYRDYLRSVFEAKKNMNRRFSFRRFSAVVGFKSPNYLQMILDGRRNLTVETATAMASRLKIVSGERDYFLALVKRGGAKNPAEINEAERARLSALKKIVSRDFPLAQKEIFGRWYQLLIRELYFLKENSAEASWISRKLGGLISEEEASHAVKLLVQAGMLVPALKSFVPADPVLDTDDQRMQAAMLRDYHADTLRTWAANLEKLSPGEQELGVLNIPISTEKIPELRRRIRQFQDEIIGWVQDEKEADRVVQLGTYLIPYP